MEDLKRIRLSIDKHIKTQMDIGVIKTLNDFDFE